MKARNIFIQLMAVILTVGTFTSCSTDKYALRQGEYDYVINKSIKKLIRNKKKSKTIISLEESYAKAQKRDLDRISFLKREGNPSNKVKIFDAYKYIVSRQQRVEPLLPLFIKKENRYARIEFGEYDNEFITAKRDAAEYLYTLSERLLAKGDRFGAREAYEHLKKLQKVYPGFRDSDQLMGKSLAGGKSQVLFEINNRSGAQLPMDFEDRIFSMSMNELDQKWADFHTRPKSGMEYDYLVRFTIEHMDVSPERIQEKFYRKEKEIVDGWSYVKDKHGRVLLDSLGQPLKQDMYRTIYSDVVEVNQHKMATINGTVDFIDLYTDDRIFREPITADAVYDYAFATARGNLDALDKPTRVLIKNGPAPFPADLDLIGQAVESLKPSVKRIVKRNDDLVIN